jgi:hypothetical protein
MLATTGMKNIRIFTSPDAVEENIDHARRAIRARQNAIPRNTSPAPAGHSTHWPEEVE